MNSEKKILELFGKMPYKPLVEENKDYAICHLDIVGKILSWNQGAQLIFGYGKDQAIGQNSAIFFTPEDRAQKVHKKELTTAKKTGRAEDTRLYIKKDGTRFFAHSVTTALCDANGALVGFAKTVRDETARNRMEEALLESEEKYRIVAETATDAIISINEKSIILFVNQAATRIFGYETEEMLGQPLTMLMPDYLRHLHTAGLERYLQTGQRHLNWEHVEIPALHRDGHEFPLELSFGEFTSNSKHVFIGIARDISQRRKAEEIIRQTQARLEAVLEAGLAGTYFYDISQNLMVTDENMRRYFSLPPEAVTAGVPLEKILPAICDEDRPHVVKALSEAIEKSGMYQIEYRVESSDGKMRWLSARGTVERDDAGTARELIGFAVDITRIKEAEAGLRESEKQLRTLADSIPQLAWMAETDGYIFWYNRRWYEYTGTTPEQMEGWGWQSVHDPALLPQILERWQHSIETGEAFEMEFPLRGEGGAFRWFLTRVNPLRDSNGNITRWFGTNTDIHENRLAQQNAKFLDSVSEDLAQLKSVKEMISTIGAKIAEYLNLSLCAFVEIDEPNNRAIVNHNWHRADLPSLIGVYYLPDFVTGEFRRAAQAGQTVIVRDVSTDERITDPQKYAALKIGAELNVPLIKDGEWKFSLAAFHDEAHDWREHEIELVRELAGRIWIRLERARAEEERERLLQSEQSAREEAERANRLKDEFLATLSHELRTPLNAILGWSQMLQNNYLDEAAVKRATGSIERNARSQSQLINDILDVSRIINGKLRLDVRAVDLRDVISAAVDAARPAAEAKNIRIQTLTDPLAAEISGDPDRLLQVIWNLFSNAIKFTPKGGSVQIRLERVNSHVEIVVSDTGTGIEPEFLPFVFERFRQSDGSTTRRHGGLGLGLAIVRQLVELHGGTVSVASDGAGQGATFTVRLPFLPVRSESADEDAIRVHPAAQDETLPDCPTQLDGLRVLLVDDETDARELLNFVLKSCGAQILSAASAAEALELIGRENFDVIISDIGMPDEDGFSLIRKIRNLPADRGGNLPAIALTAYARAEDRVRVLSCGFQMHIAKPVEAQELVAAVANLAGRTRNLDDQENR